MKFPVFLLSVLALCCLFATVHCFQVNTKKQLTIQAKELLIENQDINEFIRTSVKKNLESLFSIESCSDIKAANSTASSGFYFMNIPMLGLTRVFCDMELEEGPYLYVGRASHFYPPPDFLYSRYGIIQNDTIPDLYSLPLRAFTFEEIIFGFEDDDFPVYGGLKVPESSNTTRFFEPRMQSPRTCVKTDGFLAYEGVRFSFTTAIFAETLISVMRSGQPGGLDLASADCVVSWNSLAFNRLKDDHSCLYGFCDHFDLKVQFDGFYQNGGEGNTYGPRALSEIYPTITGLVKEHAFTRADVQPLWVMIKN